MSLSAILIGNESLTRQCGEMWLARGHRLTAVITAQVGTAAWAKAAGIPVLPPGSLPEDRADWILSIANLSVIGPDLLETPRDLLFLSGGGGTVRGQPYRSLGIPIDLYTPIFVIARVSGWSAHVLEQLSANRLIRPACIYEGPHHVPFVPVDQR